MSMERKAKLRRENYQYIKETIRLSFSLGVNLTKPSFFKDSLRLLNIFWIVCSFLCFYGHYHRVKFYKDNLMQVCEALCTYLQTLVSVFKMFYFLIVQRRFYELLEMAMKHEIIEDAQIFKRGFPNEETLRMKIKKIMSRIWQKDTRRQLLFYLFCCIGIMMNYTLNPLVQIAYNKIRGIEMTTPIPLPYTAYYPIWEDKGLSFPFYHIQFFVEVAALHVAGTCAASFDTIFIILCLHGVGLLNSVSAMIKESTSSHLPDERRTEFLRCCFHQYQKTYDYVIEIGLIFKHITLFQFLLSLMIWGMVFFQLALGLIVTSNMNTVVRMIMYISAAGYEIILYCYNGQRLITASEGIRQAIYESEWYNQSPEFRKLMRMMLLRTSRALHFDVSWFTTMSLPTLVSFFKTSGSYFLLLRNLAE